MLEILRNENASSEEMAIAFVEIERFMKNELQQEQSEAYQLCIDLQQQSMSGENVAQKLKKAKADLEDLSMRTEACSQALETLKERIALKFPVESEERIKKLNNQGDEVRKEKAQRFRDYLKAIVQACVISEELNWRRMFDSGTEWKEASPSIDFSFSRLSQDDSEFFMKELDQARKKSSVKSFSESVEGRSRNISDEIVRLERVVQGDPKLEAENLINSLRPISVPDNDDQHDLGGDLAR